jgi:hypothetical protein
LWYKIKSKPTFATGTSNIKNQHLFITILIFLIKTNTQQTVFKMTPPRTSGWGFLGLGIFFFVTKQLFAV